MEHIDNSITANSKNIELNFIWDEKIENCYVEIKDDGHGMSSKELEIAMLFAGKGIDDDRTENDLGKYGLGMKTASFFACNCLTVASKKEGGTITAKRLDQDLISESKRWIGIDLDAAPELKNMDIDHGTIVTWNNLNFVDFGKNSKKYFLEKIELIYNHISLFFHRFLENNTLNIIVNGTKVNPWNPTFTSNIGTIRIDNTIIKYNGSPVIVNSYLLPSSLNCSEEEKEEMYRGNALKYQGFFVYRNDRLLIDGGWLNIKKLTSHQQYNPVRITVDISTKLDSEFKVDFTKSLLKFPKEIENSLYEIVKTARSKASESYKNRAIKVIKPGVRCNDEIWNIVQNKNGVRVALNADHPLIKLYTKDMSKRDFQLLVKLISKSVPTIHDTDRTISFSANEIKEMTENYFVSQSLKGKNKYDIYKEICNLEPFINNLSIVQSYFEEEVFLND